MQDGAGWTMVPLIVFGFGELIRWSTTLRTQEKAGGSCRRWQQCNDEQNKYLFNPFKYMMSVTFIILKMTAHCRKPSLHETQYSKTENTISQASQKCFQS